MDFGQISFPNFSWRYRGIFLEPWAFTTHQSHNVEDAIYSIKMKVSQGEEIFSVVLDTINHDMINYDCLFH